MYERIKHSIKKIELFNKSRFKIKKIFLRSIYILKNDKNIKFKSLLHESKYNEAHNFYLENILEKNLYTLENFIEYLSLSMRLRKKENVKVVSSAILSFKQWSPKIYIFLLNNSKYKLLSFWLKKVCKRDKNFLQLLTNLRFYSNNEDKFIIKFLKSRVAAQKIQLKIKEIIADMYFNDMQSNSLYYFSVFDHIINDYLASKNFKNKKIKKKCAILNLNPWTQSIGHFILLDGFIKGVLLGILDYDIVRFSEQPKSIISNKFLHKMYKESMEKNFSFSNKNEYIFSKPNMDAWRTKGNKFTMSHKLCIKIQKIWSEKGNKPLIEITDDHMKIGDKFISKIFDNKKKWFCTLHVREPGFRFNDDLWLDTGRNAEIKNYKKGIAYIAKQKGFTIRIGQKENKKVNFKNYFDYGRSKYKSDFLDIYLISKAKFHIGTSSGLSFIPLIFGKNKNIYTNLSQPFFIHLPGSIGIPKLLKSLSSNSYQKLSTYDQIDPPLLFSGNENFKNLNLKLEENSPEDIYDIIKEFLNAFEKKEWYKIISKRKTFLIKGNNNIFCQNKIPMPKTFIKKYKNLMY